MKYELRIKKYFVPLRHYLKETMGNINDLSLLRKRSIASIIGDGYRLYMDHFTTIFRASWPLAAIYAAAFALVTDLLIRHVLTSLTMITDWSVVDWGSLLSDWWMAIGSVVLFAASALLLASSVFWVCRSHKQQGVIECPRHWWGIWPGLWYPRTLFKSCRWLLRSGMRHLGLFFATLFITLIITTAITLFCELPAVIIAIANIKAYTGSAMGDPLGMPSYLPRMTFVAFFLAGFVQAYIHLASILPLYYAFGTAYTIETERNKMKI